MKMEKNEESTTRKKRKRGLEGRPSNYGGSSGGSKPPNQR